MQRKYENQASGTANKPANRGSPYLSKELLELEQHQLVTRTVCYTRPITVEYSATAYSRTLYPVVAAMREWGLTHHQTIVGQPRPSAILPA
ncbi:winged helix-turn-helix transcriptional regulator [Hymenobacter crusticola]|uniref:HTH hxlR-type domain-containing protein n=1 Tax=Hymenobacter crusticola TaxID=1770526 RepID=A0A243W7M5_9BACT|nr:winged helix-turn-helix transcriptional regulator [Hymenobacter crusticola]OUJ70579.1 hypothetical protein BXP70_23815 [Hymenobacter crusticola]